MARTIFDQRNGQKIAPRYRYIETGRIGSIGEVRVGWFIWRGPAGVLNSIIFVTHCFYNIICYRSVEFRRAMHYL